MWDISNRLLLYPGAYLHPYFTGLAWPGLYNKHRGGLDKIKIFLKYSSIPNKTFCLHQASDIMNAGTQDRV
jgi:hypothetical protein